MVRRQLGRPDVMGRRDVMLGDVDDRACLFLPHNNDAFLRRDVKEEGPWALPRPPSPAFEDIQAS